MKILLVTIQSLPAFGGVNTYINQLEDGLRKRGHEVRIVSGNFINKLPKKTLEKLKIYEKLYYERLGKDIHKTHIQNEVGIHALKEVLKSIDIRDVDLVHSQDGMFSKVIKDIYPDLPVVGTIHGSFYSEYLQMGLIRNEMEKNLITRYDKWAVELPDELITVSSFVDPNLPMIPKRKQNIVYNGIEIDTLDIKSRSNENKLCRIITSGSLLYYKGYDILMRALAVVKEKGFDFEVYMFGDGVQFNNIQNEVKKYKLPVYLKGKISREELLDELKKGDIFIQPSRIENFPFSVVEAMASNCAVICSNVGGMVDQITHKVDGLLFESENHFDLAKQIIFLLENKEWINKFASESYAKAKKIFTKDTMLDSTERVYEKALQN